MDSLTGAPFKRLLSFFIKALAYSSEPTGLTSFALILWGLRMKAVEP